MEITQVRSATIIVNYENTKFLIDPWLGPKDYMEGFDTAVNSNIRQPRVELSFEIEKIVNVDAVIVTHIHPDHWDNYAKNALDKNIKMFVQSDIDKEYLKEQGLNNIEILNSNGTKYKNVTLYKTKTQHGRREVMEPLLKNANIPYEAMGIIFKSENEKTLYVAGDTIWCEEVKDVLDKYNPDVIVINACGATVLNGERLIMNIDDVNEVIKNCPDKTIIASHMDTVSHLTVTRDDLKTAFKNNRLLIPNDGEILHLYDLR